VLTFSCAITRRGSRLTAFAGAAFALSVLVSSAAPSQARAQEIESGGCVGSAFAYNCVDRWGPTGDPFIRIVPPPTDAAERARASERERRWVDRCRPVIDHDRYGVARYRYAMPGCEFGIGAY
jgi:hypothetical protein